MIQSISNYLLKKYRNPELNELYFRYIQYKIYMKEIHYFQILTY